MVFYARKINILNNRFWAHRFFFIALCIFCFSCNKRDAERPPFDGQSLISETEISDILRMKQSALGCPGKEKTDAPALFAHFLEQSLKDEICFDDVINNVHGTLSCAPGPFLTNQGPSVFLEQEWRLKSTPDYFVWHLDKQASVDERFYITNQSGLPLKAQTLKLKNDIDSTLVLFPKADLSPGSMYYIYMILRTKDFEKTWIQPISTKASL